MDILFFLLETAFFLLIGSALLRAWMNHLRIHMAAQPGRFVMAVTDWLVKPVRRLLPRTVAQGRIDWGSLVAALVLALVFGVIRVLALDLLHGVGLSAVASLSVILAVALKLLVRVLLQGLMVLLLVYAVLSWVQPQSPLMATLYRLCEPIVRPVRRIVPAIGGVDLSVLVLLVLLQIGLMLLA